MRNLSQPTRTHDYGNKVHKSCVQTRKVDVMNPRAGDPPKSHENDKSHSRSQKVMKMTQEALEHCLMTRRAYACIARRVIRRQTRASFKTQKLRQIWWNLVHFQLFSKSTQTFGVRSIFAKTVLHEEPFPTNENSRLWKQRSKKLCTNSKNWCHEPPGRWPEKSRKWQIP